MSYRVIATKFEGTCAHCQAKINVGDKIIWYPNSRKIYGTTCHEFKPDPAKQAVKQAAKVQGKAQKLQAKADKLLAELAALKSTSSVTASKSA